jgi:hypothetical protein
MIKKYCVLLENEQITTLLSLIKSHYDYDAKDSLQEVDLVYVSNRVDDTDAKTIIKNSWQDIEKLVGYEIRLLVNNSKTSIIKKLFKTQKEMCFIIKIRHEPEIFDPIVESITMASNIKIEVKKIKI